MYCLYILVMSSLECPYVVFVRERMTFSRFLAFLFMLSVCCLNVIPLSSVTARMVGVSLNEMGLPFSVMWGCTPYSRVHGVMSVTEDLFAETFILFVASQDSSV